MPLHVGVPDRRQAGCLEVRTRLPLVWILVYSALKLTCSILRAFALSRSEDDSVFLSITEQRSGYQGAIRVHRLNREEPTRRASVRFCLRPHSKVLISCFRMVCR